MEVPEGRMKTVRQRFIRRPNGLLSVIPPEWGDSGGDKWIGKHSKAGDGLKGQG